jgi:hypothetical protein
MTTDKQDLEAGAEAAVLGDEPIIEESSQRLFDLNVLYQTLRELRGMLANAKLNHQISKSIGIEGIHPRQFLKAISDHRQHMDLIIGLIRKAEDGEALEEPKDLGLVVTDQMPSPQKD